MQIVGFLMLRLIFTVILLLIKSVGTAYQIFICSLMQHIHEPCQETLDPVSSFLYPGWMQTACLKLQQPSLEDLQSLVWICYGLMSLSTTFKSYQDDATITGTMGSLKFLAQGLYKTELGISPRTSTSGGDHLATQPPIYKVPK